MYKDIKAIFIDMDGTLIDTDTANSSAYRYAIQKILGGSLFFDTPVHARITSNDVRNLFPNLQEEVYQQIKEIKDAKYHEYLSLTSVNRKVLDVISQHQDKIIVMVSKAQYARVISTLKHHNLLDYFDYFYCHKREHSYNKYLDAVTGLNIKPENVLVYENEEQEIANAMCAKIPQTNIIKVGN